MVTVRDQCDNHPIDGLQSHLAEPTDKKTLLPPPP